MPSFQRMTLSGENLQLDRIAQYYSDIEASVRSYFSSENVRSRERFVGYSKYEVEEV